VAVLVIFQALGLQEEVLELLVVQRLSQVAPPGSLSGVLTLMTPDNLSSGQTGDIATKTGDSFQKSSGGKGR
jgi:hypothetical protein